MPYEDINVTVTSGPGVTSIVVDPVSILTTVVQPEEPITVVSDMNPIAVSVSTPEVIANIEFPGVAVAGPRGLQGPGSNIRVYTWIIGDPAVGGVLGPRLNEDHVVTRIDSGTSEPGNVSFNIEIRPTIGTSGINILAADQTTSNIGNSLTSFASASISTGSWLYLDISDVSGTPAQLAIVLSCQV